MGGGKTSPTFKRKKMSKTGNYAIDVLNEKLTASKRELEGANAVIRSLQKRLDLAESKLNRCERGLKGWE